MSGSQAKLSAPLGPGGGSLGGAGPACICIMSQGWRAPSVHRPAGGAVHNNVPGQEGECFHINKQQIHHLGVRNRAREGVYPDLSVVEPCHSSGHATCHMCVMQEGWTPHVYMSRRIHACTDTG